jgi:CTP-dependent riboflavin kinase
MKKKNQRTPNNIVQKLSNKKTITIEKSFRQQIVKATDTYLKVELEKYRHLTIIVEPQTK